MITEDILMELGLAKDKDNLYFKKIFKNNVKIKEIHIDIYSENPLIVSSPFMLLLRTIEKKIIVSNDDDRLILKKNVDRFLTYFMNIKLSEIKECYYKSCNNCFEFIVKVQNIYYRITIFN